VESPNISNAIDTAVTSIPTHIASAPAIEQAALTAVAGLAGTNPAVDPAIIASAGRTVICHEQTNPRPIHHTAMQITTMLNQRRNAATDRRRDAPALIIKISPPMRIICYEMLPL
jgi:hypothetical protein